MRRSLIVPLILKDWYLQRGTLAIMLAGGLLGIVLQLAGGLVAVFGLTSTFACTIILGIGLCQSIVNERTRQNETFVMSLPVTPLEYAVAKVLANLSMFMAVWLALMVVLFLQFVSNGLPGLLPPATVAAFGVFVGFCTMLCVAIVVRSERIWILTMTATNFGYAAIWLAIARIPDIGRQVFQPVALWSEHVLWLLGIELLLLVVVLALGAYLQSRKASFL